MKESESMELVAGWHRQIARLTRERDALRTAVTDAEAWLDSSDLSKVAKALTVLRGALVEDGAE